MPVGKESVKRATGARKKTTAKKAAPAAKAETKAAETAEAVVAENVIANPEIPEKLLEKNRTYGIKDELPIYLL